MIYNYIPGHGVASTELIDEVMDTKRPETRKLLRFFAYDHLSPQLQQVSAPFWNLAFTLIYTQEEAPELTVALRKLLEAKDCAVRNALA